MRFGAGNNDRVIALVDRNGELRARIVLPPRNAARNRFEQLIEHTLYFAHVSVFQFENAHLDFAARAFRIELLDDLGHFLNVRGRSAQK